MNITEMAKEHGLNPTQLHDISIKYFALKNHQHHDEYQEAEKHCLALIEEFPKCSLFLYELAGIYIQTHQPESAMQCYEKLRLAKKANEHAYLYLSKYYLGKGDLFRSIDTIKEGASYFPNSEKIKDKLHYLMDSYDV